MDNDKQLDYTCMDATKNYFYIIAISCVVSIVLGLIYILSSRIMGVSYNAVIDMQWAIYIGIIITPISYLALYFVYHKKNKIAMFEKPSINVWFVLMSVVMAGVCIFAIAPITNWISIGLQHLGLKLNASLSYEMNTWWQIVFGVIGYAMLPAVAEELLYRRVILKGFLNKHTVIGSILMTAFLFTIMHGSLRQFFYQIILGLILTAMAYVTKSVIYPIVFHFTNNLAVVILQLTGSEYLVSGSALSSSVAVNVVLYLLLAIVGLGLIFCAFYVISKETTCTDNKNNIIYGKSFTKNQTQAENTYFYLSLIIVAVIWISNTVSYFM